MPSYRMNSNQSITQIKPSSITKERDLQKLFETNLEILLGVRFIGSEFTTSDRQRELRKLETKRDEAWRSYDQATRELDCQKDALLDEISSRLEQITELETLFTNNWNLI